MCKRPVRILQFVCIIFLILVIAQASDISYSMWQDPSEGAFSCQMPIGWNVDAGIARYSVSDYRPYIEVTSPDNTIRIKDSDKQIPRLLSSKYMTAEEFAKWYIANYLANDGTGLTFQDSRSINSADQSIFPGLTQIPLVSKAYFSSNKDCVEVLFSYYKDGQLMKGYYLAGTELYPPPSNLQLGFNLWRGYGGGYTSPPSEEEIAKSVMTHIESTLNPNSQWLQRQNENGKNLNAQALASAYNSQGPSTYSPQPSSDYTPSYESNTASQCSYVCPICWRYCTLTQGHYGKHMDSEGHTWL
jgi:hypothetical protein